MIGYVVPDGAALMELRERRGLSQGALAKASKVGRETISRIESGRTNSVYPRTLKKLARALQAEPEAIVIRDEDVNPGRSSTQLFIAINGPYVLARRKTLFMTQAELATAIGRTRVTVAKIEHAIPEVPCMVMPKTMRALAKVLKCDTSSLIDTENQPDYMQEYYSTT